MPPAVLDPQTCFFPILGAVLRERMAEDCSREGVSFEAAGARIHGHLVANSARWRGFSRPSIPYGDPDCRLSYLYSQTAVNATLLEFLLRTRVEIAETVDAAMKREGTVRIGILGSGPGTDFLAVWRWAHRASASRPLRLELTLTDRESDWSDCCRGLFRHAILRTRSRFGDDPEGWPFRIQARFRRVDLAVRPREAAEAVADCHLVVMSYVLSELMEDLGGVTACLGHLSRISDPETRLLLVDRGEDRVLQAARRCLFATGWRQEKIGYTESRMLLDDRPEGLGEVRKWIRPVQGEAWFPRLSWRAFYTVSRAPAKSNGVKHGWS